MSSELEPLALRCDDLYKNFTLGEHLSLQRSLAALLPGRSAALPRFSALRGVTFDVPRGAYFGIVGSNGSGKSTLTQLISGIAVPTAGEVRVWGRVLPLLEVGAGFHEELTGRENVSLLGAILGLTREQVAASLPRIVDFAGVEAHLDTPLKRYSSGMKARLSFATAICFPADIYVFDEVLAVVDDDFRNSCVEQLQALNATGKTIIFMSHDLELVRTSCRTGMWLEKGEVQVVGSMDEVASAYSSGTAHFGAEAVQAS
jgi:ABC-type polysaccharide/polyol phosphate transport system ATPase subunit